MSDSLKSLEDLVRTIQEEEHWEIRFPELYCEEPKITNIKRLYEVTKNENKSSLRRAWNAYIKEKGDVAAKELRAVLPTTMKPIPEVEVGYKLLFSICFMAVGYFLIGWIGVGIGIIVLLLLLIHHNIWDIEHGRQRYARSLADAKVVRTHSFILGWQLTIEGNFFREEAPWAYPIDHPYNVSEYLP